MTYFVPNFLLIISMKSILVHLAPPTQKNTKNCRKFGKNRFGLISIFSRLGPKSKKPLDQNFRLFLVILKRLLAWFYLLWGFQKSVLCDFQYFDINVRGRGSNFRLFLLILKRLSAWFYLLWVFQKSAYCETQYFDINVRGRGSNFFSPNFLDVFLDVESDKKNRFKFWPLFHPPGPKQFFFYFAHIF